MSQGTITLLAGALLAVGALAFVLYPLFFETRDQPRARPTQQPGDDSAIVALREIEFDKATGKLSDADYVELKQSYSARALEELRARERATPSASEGAASHPGLAGSPERSPAVPSDPIEARIREFRETHRACSTCGVRPEADAIYCSTCGAWLDRACPGCSAPVAEASATFCSTCGVSLTTAVTAAR